MNRRLHFFATIAGVLAPILIHLPTVVLFAQGRFVESHGARIYYEEQGKGDPIVLIHGWSLNLRMWDPQVADLARQYRVIRYDRRGFGQSSGSEDVTWDVEDLRALLDALGIERAHVLGMSQGARPALTFAASVPHRVSSLILHGSPAPDGFGLPYTGADRLSQPDFEKLAQASGLEAARKAWIAHPLPQIPPGHPDATRRLDALVAGYRGERWLKPPTPSGPTMMATMVDLAKVKAPTLILVGDSEVPYLRIVADALTYGISGARKAVVPGGGHLVNIIEPRAYNRAVLDFLDTVRARP